MKPGRGNNPKTGHGMPSQLMSGSPLKQQQPRDFGLKRAEQTGDWEARPYEKSVSEDAAYVYVKNSKGGIVNRADKRNKKAVEKLKSDFNKDLAENQFRRNKSADVQNAISKTTTTNRREQNVQMQLKKARYNQAGQVQDVDKSHAEKSERVRARDKNKKTI